MAVPVTNYTLTYNGVTLTLTHITNWDQELVESDDDTDPMYHHISISIRGYLNQDFNGIPPGTSVVQLRSTLLEPRQALLVQIGNVNVIQGGGIDQKNGPIPKNVKVTPMGATVMVEFSIETWIQDCTTFGKSILSNRWSQKVEYDTEALATLTSNGSLIISSQAGANVDSFRELIWPLKFIPAGFQRGPIMFNASSDGLRLDWQVTDKQAYRAATSPAITWTGRWTEGSDWETGVGVQIQASLSLSVTGALETSKTDLLSWIMEIFLSRIREGDIVRSYELGEDLDKNNVFLNVVIIVFSQQNAPTSSGGDTIEFGLKITTRIGTVIPVLDYNDAGANVIGSRNAYYAQLYTQLLTTTCQNVSGGPEVQYSQNIQPTNYGQSIGINPKQTDTYKNKVSDAQYYPYIRTKLETKVYENTNVIQLPTGATYSGRTNPSPATFIQIGTGVTEKRCRFVMERLNAIPVLPQPYIDDNHILLSAVNNMSQPELLPDGQTYIYIITGEYIFGQIYGDVIAMNTLTMPASPTTTDNIDNGNVYDLSSGNYQSGLIA